MIVRVINAHLWVPSPRSVKFYSWDLGIYSERDPGSNQILGNFIQLFLNKSPLRHYSFIKFGLVWYLKGEKKKVPTV